MFEMTKIRKRNLSLYIWFNTESLIFGLTVNLTEEIEEIY